MSGTVNGNSEIVPCRGCGGSGKVTSTVTIVDEVAVMLAFEICRSCGGGGCERVAHDQEDTTYIIEM